MNITKAKQLLKQILIKNHLPVLLWGQPGVGKTAICRQIAEELNWKFLDIRLPLLTPSDILGIPFPDKEHKRTNWLYPSFFPDPESEENYLILFDEIGNSTMAVQNSCYRIILDRSISDQYKFPPNVRMVAASNREKDKSGVGRFSQALANRFIHFYIEADLNSWKSWALVNNINEKIIGFLTFKPDMLCKEPNIEDKAYPTCRSWEYVSRLLSFGITDEDAISGAVGQGASSEFLSYLEVYSQLPDVNKILRGEKVPVPKELSALYALSSSLVIKSTKTNINHIFDYCAKMPKEFEVLTLRDIARKDESVFNAYSEKKDWLDKHSYLFDEEDK